eukprot:TRINITY_DN4100_c0_g1_i1.p1 TRINITY_DN4100_c0_g1~~TRINITY_DN4100_c0_g1_i1.p1  ORF type:complete len:114 (-),score=17.33 TRINITY_DN4100_c0_g1_i1:142-483(-)
MSSLLRSEWRLFYIRVETYGGGVMLGGSTCRGGAWKVWTGLRAYLEDPIMVAEYVVYLQQNFCTSDMHHCHDTVAAHFPAMHDMAMEKFFIPTEICNQEPVCTGEDPPTKPPQ